MISQSSIVEKTGTLLNETIHIMPECAMHLHYHWNKVVPLMKLSIYTDPNNGVKFHSYTYWLTNDTRSHRLLRWVNNHHIYNKDLILLGHVKISS
jgi:hypothetical protein